MTSGTDDVTIGLDLGTSGLKAVAVTVAGEILARAQASYPTQRPEPLAAEQAPADWLAAVAAAVTALAGEVAPSRWRCLGLSAMIPTLVTTDPAFDVTGPAVTWEDARAQPEADRLLSLAGDDYRQTGQRLDGRYLLPMLTRLARSDPERYSRTAWMLAAKDYLFHWLTGVVATDPSTATGFGGYRLDPGGWLEPVWHAAGIVGGGPLPRRPELSPARRTAPIRSDLAERLGLPGRVEVCLGVADSVAGAIGLGATRPGDVAYIAGTSTVILAASDRPAYDSDRRYIVTPMADPASWGLEMDLLATGSATRWLARLVGVDEIDLIERARGRDPLDAPTFLPYLAPGEQGALWDPTLTGAMSGLDLHHDAADLARGLLTGIALESRRCLTVLREVTGHDGRVYLGGGGGATSVAFGQELADASGRQVVLASDTTDHSALGAARLAARASGDRVADGHDGHDGWDAPDDDRVITPRAETARSWALLDDRHQRALGR